MASEIVQIINHQMFCLKIIFNSGYTIKHNLCWGTVDEKVKSKSNMFTEFKEDRLNCIHGVAFTWSEKGSTMLTFEQFWNL